MSRNLADTCCKICRADSSSIELEEKPRPITREECMPYERVYESLIVANASCKDCGAKYLAWVSHDFSSGGGRLSNWRREPYEGGPPFVDLSFRASFNDEPAPEDLPTPEKLRELHRAACYARHERLVEEAEALMKEAEQAKRDADEKEPFYEGYRKVHG